MHHQRTRPTPRPERRVTHFDELEATSTLRRIAFAVDDAASADAAGAEQAWRQVARLASRLERQARAIARDLESH